jgi:chromosome segregation protein
MTASEQIKVKLRELSEERIHTQKSIEGYKQQLSDWKERHSKLASESSELKSERVELERKLKADSAEIERVRGEASKLEVETAELRLHIKAKGDTAREKFGLDLDTLTPPPVSEKGILEQNGGKLKRKLQAIGAVNLLALEEYGIQRERFNFLQSEYEDIIKSKEELLETITRTNAEARARFKDVFDRVSEYFSLLFKDLFEGGEGKLSLSGGDPLEAEIQLQANPAGKKLGTLEQMSGGEKTMTALAFLFSLYQVKPSPFCILDEVDAPLDDANVKRFLKLIQRFTPQTQFILVTHNKLTMEACDYLYGVTMEEEGISKIISVKMET